MKDTTSTVQIDSDSTHVPVLLHTVVDNLHLEAGMTVLDATLGAAGYSIEALNREPNITIVGLDVDPEAVTRAKAKLSRMPGKHIVVESNFRDVAHVLDAHNVDVLDAAMFDLGISSFQLDGMTVSPRGMSFKRDEPLVMTLSGKDDGLTAHEIVNEWAEESIADIIYGYGEERYARRIAGAIVARRIDSPIQTTFELVDVIKGAVPAAYRNGRIHPATRTFQALRITVNDELGALKDGLRAVYDRLAPGARLVVVSFHSLEDRIVKRFFRDSGSTVITKKPLTPTDEEIIQNPRARSAKLRILEK